MKKVNPDGSKTIYVAGLYEVDKNSGGTVTQTRTYYPAGGAMRINSTLYYILKDHLDSASVGIDASGNTVGEDRFYPFGETRFTTGTMYTDRLFTGQRDTGLGIYYFNARFYSQKLGRFLSPDTIVPSYANPQSLNRYSYVTDNPLRYVDPTGHVSCSGSNWDDGPQCTNKTSFWQTAIQDTFNWKVAKDFALKELKIIYQTGHDIEKYVDGLTGGKGNAWIRQNMGNTTFVHAGWEDSHAETWPKLFGGATINLGKNWLNDLIWTPRELVAHELGHVWDIHTSFAASADLINDLEAVMHF